ncbi:hypothetical protein A3C37_02130 [Candidatus Peribacteria bacterium RIFCSPHIGHO2_02_FULL_53_20]|nr:MAG: hypothetical protein A3C37_02130 [Candidatus Peribacteria bacterium RIFCSPHIGHO2_02_FULL_53_20]OGJ66584.1 MAG: hypothetical protein A3B61_01575 [Candidatus Peribacteria bacterium RIFCSPLOWO2_01_FULL_53_10]
MLKNSATRCRQPDAACRFTVPRELANPKAGVSDVIGANKILTLRFRVDVPAYLHSGYAYVRIVDANHNVLAEEGAGHVGRNRDRELASEILGFPVLLKRRHVVSFDRLMKEVSSSNFGLLIAFLLPGFAVLWGASYFSETVALWLSGSGTTPTVVLRDLPRQECYDRIVLTQSCRPKKFREVGGHFAFLRTIIQASRQGWNDGFDFGRDDNGLVTQSRLGKQRKAHYVAW